MAGGVEREFKLRIPGEPELCALIARLGGSPGPPALQRNHFFDTPSRALRRARLALRLRTEEGQATLCLKGPLRAGGGTLAVRPEEELALSPSVAEALLAGQRGALEVLAGSALAGSALVAEARACAGSEALQLAGSFENERLRIGPLAFPPGSAGPPLVFELDRTRFPGGRVERELEVELPEAARPAEVRRALAALFAGLGLPFEPAPSKAARLFRILDARAPTADGGGDTHV